VSTGAIVAIAFVGMLVAAFVPLRIDVARQRRAVETARARLAVAKVRRRAEGVPVEVVLKIGERFTHIPRASTVALADDGFYCLSADGRWGGRVRFATGPAGPGDVVLAATPALVKGAAAVGGDLPAWLAAALSALPPDGLVLQFQGDLSWFIAVPDAADWHAALTQAIREAA
jgi:hypothetical protein